MEITELSDGFMDLPAAREVKFWTHLGTSVFNILFTLAY